MSNNELELYIKKKELYRQVIDEKFLEALHYLNESSNAEYLWHKAVAVFPSPFSIRLTASESFICNNMHVYPQEEGSSKLREAILTKFKSDNLSVTDKNIYADFGTFEILDKIYRTLDWNVCKSIMLSTPVYSRYITHFIDSNLDYEFLETNETTNWKITPKSLDEALKITGSKVFILNNPHNPTGIYYTKKELDELALVFKKHKVLVISDEIFKEVVLVDGEEKPYSIGAIEGMKNATITLNGLSKSMALAGIRLSFAAIPEWLLEKLPKKINGFAIPCETAIIKGLEINEENTVYKNESIKEYNNRLKLIKSFLDKINKELNEKHKTNSVYANLIAEPKSTNVVLISFKGIKSAKISSNGKEINSGNDLVKYIYETTDLSLVPGEFYHLKPEYISVRIPLSSSPLEDGFMRIKSALLKLEF